MVKLSLNQYLVNLNTTKIIVGINEKIITNIHKVVQRNKENLLSQKIIKIKYF